MAWISGSAIYIFNLYLWPWHCHCYKQQWRQRCQVLYDMFIHEEVGRKVCQWHFFDKTISCSLCHHDPFINLSKEFSRKASVFTAHSAEMTRKSSRARSRINCNRGKRKLSSRNRKVRHKGSQLALNIFEGPVKNIRHSRIFDITNFEISVHFNIEDIGDVLGLFLQFDISGMFEIAEFDIASVYCTCRLFSIGWFICLGTIYMYQFKKLPVIRHASKQN